MPTKASNNISIYVNDELAQRLTDAKAEGRFDPKQVAKDALIAALDGPAPAGDSAEQETPRFARELAQALGLEGDTSWSHLLTEVKTMIENDLEVDALHKTQWREVIDALGLEGEENTTLEYVVGAIKELRQNPLVQVASGDGSQHTLYDVVWAESPIELQARIDSINAQGGWLQSIAPDKDDRYLLLIAWPQPESDPTSDE